MVAAPAALLAVGGFIWMARRNKQKDAELRDKLDLAEAQMAATAQGFEALAQTLARATQTLTYIGVHAAHAQQRWSDGLGERPAAWARMTEDQKRAYQDFITIAGCQLSVARIPVEAFLSTLDDNLNNLIVGINEVLSHADRTVRQLV